MTTVARTDFHSAAVLIAGDDPLDFQALSNRLAQAYPPHGLAGQRALREMAAAEWRLLRVRQYLALTLDQAIRTLAAADPEASVLELQCRAYLELTASNPGFRQFLRFETRFERAFERARRELEKAAAEYAAQEPAAAPASPRTPIRPVSERQPPVSLTDRRALANVSHPAPETRSGPALDDPSPRRTRTRPRALA